MIIENNRVEDLKIESPGELKISSAEHMLQNL